MNITVGYLARFIFDETSDDNGTILSLSPKDYHAYVNQNI